MNESILESIRHYFRVYVIIAGQYVKARMQYKVDFLISSIGAFFVQTAGFIVFWVLYKNIPSIRGWKFNEIIFIYGYSLIALVPLQLFFQNVWSLRENIITGNLTKYYFRPLSLLFSFMSEVFDIKALGQFIFGAYLIYYASPRLDIHWNPLSFIWFIILVISSSLIIISILLMGASIVFYSNYGGDMNVFLYKLKDYSRYPVTIFSSFFKITFTFILPVSFLGFYPSLFFIRPWDVPALSYLTPVVGIVFTFIAYRVWKKGLTFYTGAGSN
jgi:ABC-2 type transport system permease protein